jgi:hypothetical protein
MSVATALAATRRTFASARERKTQKTEIATGEQREAIGTALGRTRSACQEYMVIEMEWRTRLTANTT